MKASANSNLNDIQRTLIQSTADIITAMLDNGHKGDVKKLMREIYQEFVSLAEGSQPQGENEESAKRRTPKVSVKDSVQPDYIVCLEDGKQLKMLKRYLKTHYDMTPEDYRKRWNLPADYPMVAPNYAKKRSQLAHKIGLGKKRTTATKARAGRPAKKRAS